MTYIILEGVDGAGKTTLSERLAMDYGARVVPLGPPGNPDKACAEYVDRLLTSPPLEPTVFDRFHWGSQAYGEVFRGRRDLSVFEMSVIDRMLLHEGAVAVYCRPHWSQVSANVARRAVEGRLDPRGYEDDLTKLARVEIIMDECFSTSMLPKIIYNYEVTPLDDVHSFVQAELGLKVMA